MMKVGHNVAGESISERFTPIEDGHIDIIEHMLSKLAPQLKDVCSTVKDSLEGANEGDLEAKITDTLGSCVTKNLGAILKSNVTGHVAGLINSGGHVGSKRGRE